MPWYVLATICTLAVSIANIISRSILKKEESDPIGFSIVFTFLLSAMSFTFSLIIDRFYLPPIDKFFIPFAAAVLLWALWTILYFKGVKLLGAGEVAILSSLGIFFLVVLGIIFFHEKISMFQIVGILLIVLSSCLVIFEHLSFKSKKGIILIIASSFVSSVAIMMDTIVIRQYDSFSYLSIASFFVALVLLVIFPKKIKTFTILKDRLNGPKIILYSFFWTTQSATYYLALQGGAKVSLLAPFVRSSGVIIIILAFIFLKERKYIKRKIIASIITLIGLVLLR